MKPAAAFDPFAGPSLQERTAMTGIVAPQTGAAPLRAQTRMTGIVAPQTNPEVQKKILNKTGMVKTGAEVIPPPQPNVIAGVNPRSQYEYNMRRLGRGQTVVYPTHLDPLMQSMNYLGTR